MQQHIVPENNRPIGSNPAFTYQRGINQDTLVIALTAGVQAEIREECTVFSFSRR
jgi:hypothetical protein